MSIPRRLLRIAVDKIREGIDEGMEWIPGTSPRKDARRELDDFLADPVPRPIQNQASAEGGSHPLKLPWSRS